MIVFFLCLRKNFMTWSFCHWFLCVFNYILRLTLISEHFQKVKHLKMYWKHDFLYDHSIRKRFSVWKNYRQLRRFCDRTLTERHVMWKIFWDMWCEMKRVTCDMKWMSDMWYEMIFRHVMWKMRHVMWKNDMLHEMKDMLCEMISDRLFDVDRLFEETVYLMVTVKWYL